MTRMVLCVRPDLSVEALMALLLEQSQEFVKTIERDLGINNGLR